MPYFKKSTNKKICILTTIIIIKTLKMRLMIQLENGSLLERKNSNRLKSICTVFGSYDIAFNCQIAFSCTLGSTLRKIN